MASRRLYRSLTEKKIAGVCGGIAEHLDADPVFVRLAWVAATLIMPPVGTLGYLACWLIIPFRPESETELAPEPSATAAQEEAPVLHSTLSGPPERDGSLVGGAIFIGIGLFFLLINLGILDWEMFRFWRWRMVWPLVLILLGVYMLFRSLRPQSRPQER